jgi:hypothetical protein
MKSWGKSRRSVAECPHPAELAIERLEIGDFFARKSFEVLSPIEDRARAKSLPFWLLEEKNSDFTTAFVRA